MDYLCTKMNTKLAFGYKKPDDTKLTIFNNEPIEEYLHVVGVISNPCNYKTRYRLAKEFIDRMKYEKHIKLYVVELCYGDQEFKVTHKTNPRHLQIRTDSPPLWHKENMINIGVNKLFPKNWKAFAWVDMDIEFEDPYWALNTLKILNGSKDIVQLFTHANDMNYDGSTMNLHSSFGYQYVKRNQYVLQVNPNNAFHPGYCWAYTRKAYEQLRGMLELSILGSGDHGMALSLIGKAHLSLNNKVSDGYKKYMANYEFHSLGLRLGYIPGTINHHFHGQKVKRYYNSRWLILTSNKYDPYKHINYTKDGLLIPSKKMPQKLLDDIMTYFKSRDEDEFCEA